MERKDKDDNEEYKKRNKALIDGVEMVENSPEMYQVLLDRIAQITQKAIAITNKKSRNGKSVFGFVFALREYYWLSDDPKYPFTKERFPEEIDALYKLIYKELKKPNRDLLGSFDIHDRKMILKNMTKALGVERVANFCTKYKVDQFVRIDTPTKNQIKYRNLRVIDDAIIEVNKITLLKKNAKLKSEKVYFQGQIDSQFLLIFEEIKKPDISGRTDLEDRTYRSFIMVDLKNKWDKKTYLQFTSAYGKKYNKLLPSTTREKIEITLMFIIIYSIAALIVVFFVFNSI